ncbi:MAG: phosphotransferase [Planctomycetales bacterium]|nr:phosphotransferase [Planctomycetales bacterium]
MLQNSQTPDQSVTLLGKIRFKGLDEKTPRLTKYLHQHGFGKRSLVRVPEVLGTVPSLHMWLQEFVAGEVVGPQKRNLVEVQPQIATAISKLHESKLPIQHTHTVLNEIKTLDKLYAELSHCEMQHNLMDLLPLLIKSYRKAAANLLISQPAVLHRDFYFDQVLIHNDQTVLIDLDTLSLGPAALDIGNYIGHFIEYAVRDPDCATSCIAACNSFLRSSYELQPTITSSMILSWTILSIARLIPISRKFPDRYHVTLPLADLLLNLGNSKSNSPFIPRFVW